MEPNILDLFIQGDTVNKWWNFTFIQTRIWAQHRLTTMVFISRYQP